MGTPSARLISASQLMEPTTDAFGRRIALRKTNALDKLRLLKAAGPVLAQNQPWLAIALFAASVTAIDDVPVPMPANEGQIEALVARLGDEGLAAIATALAPLQAAPADIAAVAGN